MAWPRIEGDKRRLGTKNGSREPIWKQACMPRTQHRALISIMPARHEVPTLTERGGGAIQGCFFNEVVLLGFVIESWSLRHRRITHPLDRAGISEQNVRGTFRPVRAPEGGSTSVRFFLQGRSLGSAERSPPSAERSRPRWAPRLVSGGAPYCRDSLRWKPGTGPGPTVSVLGPVSD